VVEARINGVVTGEAGINALVAAHYGVPVVLVTGDRVACEGEFGHLVVEMDRVRGQIGV